jgi:hypothetical protein
VVLNADTDGDLRAVHAGREDAPGTPAGNASPEDASRADFAGVSSRELGQTANRLIDALAHRTDETAMKELRRLLGSLQQTVTEASQIVTDDGYPPVVERTDPGQDPVWERWFR